MELHLNREGQLRITLSEDDMENYALQAESMDYDDTATRRAFWEILDEAKKQTGFDAARERMLIQVFPHKSGGCEMRVTPVNLAHERQNSESQRLLQPSRTTDDQSLHSTQGKGDTLLVRRFYTFDTPDALLLCCAMLKSDYSGKSEAWFEPLNGSNGRYYLSVREPKSGGYPFLGEFAVMSGGVTLSYIREHGRVVAEKNAVSRLASLYETMKNKDC